MLSTTAKTVMKATPLNSTPLFRHKKRGRVPKKPGLARGTGCGLLLQRGGAWLLKRGGWGA